MPLMVTGGFRSRPAMDAALDADALDMIGLGKPFAEDPDIAVHLLAESSAKAMLKVIKLPLPALTGLAEMAWAKSQIHRIAAGKKPNPPYGPFLNFVRSQFAQKRDAKRYRAWLARSA